MEAFLEHRKPVQVRGLRILERLVAGFQRTDSAFCTAVGLTTRRLEDRLDGLVSNRFRAVIEGREECLGSTLGAGTAAHGPQVFDGLDLLRRHVVLHLDLGRRLDRRVLRLKVLWGGDREKSWGGLRAGIIAAAVERVAEPARGAVGRILRDSEPTPQCPRWGHGGHRRRGLGDDGLHLPCQAEAHQEQSDAWDRASHRSGEVPEVGKTG